MVFPTSDGGLSPSVKAGCVGQLFLLGWFQFRAFEIGEQVLRFARFTASAQDFAV